MFDSQNGVALGADCLLGSVSSHPEPSLVNIEQWARCGGADGEERRLTMVEQQQQIHGQKRAASMPLPQQVSAPTVSDRLAGEPASSSGGGAAAGGAAKVAG